jgi:ligand-binding sensor domain-containing protein
LAVWILIIPLFSCLQSQSVSLQNLHIRRWTVKDGLQNDRNNIIYHDHKGFIWVGGYGLQRFDGYRFERFPFEENTSIVRMTGDDNGFLYIIDDDGQLWTCHPSSGKYTLYQAGLKGEMKKEKLTFLNCQKDNRGNIWFLLSGKLAVLKAGQNQLTNVSEQWPLSGEFHNNRFFMEEGRFIWMLSEENGIIRYDTQKGVLSHRQNHHTGEKIFQFEVKDENIFAKDKSGNYWFSDTKIRHIKKYNPLSGENTFFTFPYPNRIDQYSTTFINDFYVDLKGEFWVRLGEFTGLAKYNKVKNTFDILYSDKTKENGLYNDLVIGSSGGFFAQDIQGNYWYAGDGLMMFHPSRQYIQTILTQDVVKKTLKDAHLKLAGAQSYPVDFVEMNDGKIYVGYYGLGLVKFDSEFENPEMIKMPGYISELIWKMFSADGENLYFGDQKKGLYVYNIRSKTFSEISNQNSLSDYLSASFVENDTTVWLGHYYTGLKKFNPKRRTFTLFNGFSDQKSERDKHIFDIEPQGNHHLWVATNKGGLILFDKKSGKTLKQFFPSGKRLFHHNNTVHNIERYNTDTLLLSANQGFIIFNTRNQKYSIITTKNGLPENHCITSMTSANPRFVWISTITRGIYQLDMQTKKVYPTGQQQGNALLLGEQSSFKLPDGKILFGQHKGFTLISGLEQTNRKRDSVYITYVKVNNRLLPVDSIMAASGRMRFSSKNNNISLGFSTLNFWNLPVQEFFIYIPQLHNSRESIGSEAELELRGLAPGKYEIFLQSMNKNTREESKVTKLFIEIVPPFYATFWFLGICFLVLLFCLYQILKWRQNERLKAEQLKTLHFKKELEYEQQKSEVESIKQQMNDLQLSALQSQMNPHFIFNSLNSINNYIIKNDIHAASEYLTKFSRLIRLILDNSKNNEITLAKELETLRLYLLIEAVRFSNKFNYQIEIDETVDAEHIMIPPTTIQPFTENAIWHGIMHLKHPGQLHISLRKADEDTLLISIDDNGIGRKKSAEFNNKSDEHKSHGVNITTKRILQLHPKNRIETEDKFDADGNATGTRVNIFFIIQKNKNEA